MDSETITALTTAITTASKILVVGHSRPTVDTISSLAVTYSVLKSHFKKEVDIAIPADISPRYNAVLARLGISHDMVLTALPQTIYTINIKKSGEKIESIKFDEDEEQGLFKFMITPFNGNLDLNSVKVEKNGANYDLVVVIDTPSLNFLGDLYKQNVSVFDESKLVTIDSHKSNAKYAKYQIYDAVDTTSQVLMHLLEKMTITIDEEYATILHAGVTSFLQLGLRDAVRPSTYQDLAKLVKYKAHIAEANALLYAPFNLNEIFLVGDILDSSNEGEASVLNNAKVVGCKINLNKEELNSVDMDKTAQVVFWNVKVSNYQLAYVIFQRSQTESVAYIYAYTKLDLEKHMQNLGGQLDRGLMKITFDSDMNSAESKIKAEFGLSFTKNDTKFNTSNFDALEEDEDDFDLDEPAIFNTPTPTMPSFNVPPLPSVSATPSAPKETASTGKPDESKDATQPPKFDPRLGH